MGLPAPDLGQAKAITSEGDSACASQQKLRADVADGSWLCENSSGRATRRNISEQLHLWESNHTAQATFDALPENCVFYISRMYEFLHRLGQTRSFGDVCPMSGLPPESGLKSDLVTSPRCADFVAKVIDGFRAK
jgi:hypothetical protein